MKTKDDVVIVRPEDLANAYGEHLLIVGSDGKPEPGTEVPERIFMRYETATELLYINTKVFTWLGLGETLKVWRKSQQYCGPMNKRMGSGAGTVIPPDRVVVFDLSEKPEERTAPIRPRRGKPLQVERVRARAAVAVKAEQSAFDIHRRLSVLRVQYPTSPLLDEVEGLYKDMKKVLEEANRLMLKGKKPGVSEGTKRKKHVPQDERVRVTELDTFIKENVRGLHRILRRFVLVDGKQKFEDKVIRPRLDPTDWVGRYEEIANEETGHTTKTLYIPVAVLKAMPELGNYAMDYRFVLKKYRFIGAGTMYCAVFDMGRVFRGLDI